jgi:hypothetical protein
VSICLHSGSRWLRSTNSRFGCRDRPGNQKQLSSVAARGMRRLLRRSGPMQRTTSGARYKPKNVDGCSEVYRVFGVDLSNVPGISGMTTHKRSSGETDPSPAQLLVRRCKVLTCPSLNRPVPFASHTPTTSSPAGQAQRATVARSPPKRQRMDRIECANCVCFVSRSAAADLAGISVLSSGPCPLWLP